jgi:site-specific recombinase XerD
MMESFLLIEKQHIITRDEYERLLKACEGDVEYQALIETLYWYGCRISELLSMPLAGVATNEVGVESTKTTINNKKGLVHLQRDS